MDYLQSVEEIYSQCRGRPSRLSPMDWQLASDWERDGVPLFIVTAAMLEAVERFRARNPNDTINSLKYFSRAVRSRFETWQRSQVGAPVELEAEPVQYCDQCREHHGKVLVLVDPEAKYSWEREELQECPNCAIKRG